VLSDWALYDYALSGCVLFLGLSFSPVPVWLCLSIVLCLVPLRVVSYLAVICLAVSCQAVPFLFISCPVLNKMKVYCILLAQLPHTYFVPSCFLLTCVLFVCFWSCLKKMKMKSWHSYHIHIMYIHNILTVNEGAGKLWWYLMPITPPPLEIEKSEIKIIWLHICTAGRGGG
jgi:hypothetical protein